MAPIFEDGNNKKDRPREDDLFDRSSLCTPLSASRNIFSEKVNIYIAFCPKLQIFSGI